MPRDTRATRAEAAHLILALAAWTVAASVAPAHQSPDHESTGAVRADSASDPEHAPATPVPALSPPPWLGELAELPHAPDIEQAAQGEQGSATRNASGSARMSFERAVEDLARQLDAPPNRHAAQDTDPADAAPDTEPDPDPEAAKRYTRARAALLEGDAPRAAELARAALELVPDDPDANALLGLALIELGEDVQAADRLVRAIGMGNRNPSVLWHAARLREGQEPPRTRAMWLASAARSPGRRGDPGLDHLILIDLGESMLDAGYLRAGLESLELGFDLGNGFTVRTDYESSLAELGSRAPELLIRMGDTACRLGLYDRAVDAYSRLASGSRGQIPDEVRDRLVYALASSGKGDEAGGRIADRAVQRNALLDNRLVILAEHLSPAPGFTQAARATLLGLAPEEVAQSNAVATWWDRLLAGSMPDAPASVALMRRLGRDPEDDLTAIALLRRGLRASGEPGMLSLAVETVRAEPRAAATIARAIEALRPETEPWIDLLLGEPGRVPESIAARLLLAAERPRDAARHAPLELDPSELDAHDLLLRVRVSVALGDHDQAWSDLDELDRRASGAAKDPDNRADNEAIIALLDALLATQSPDRVVERAREALDRGSLSAPDRERVRRRLVEVGERYGRPDLIREAHAATLMSDPYDPDAMRWAVLDERSSDAVDTSGVIARLRERAPRARVTRLLRVRQLASNELWDAAESEAVGLYDERPWDSDALDLALAVWTRSGGVDREPRVRRGLRWVETKLDRRPGSLDLIRVKVRLLAALGDGAQADAFLSELRQAGDRPSLARLHEQVVGTLLNDPERARSMRTTRLDGAPMSIGIAVETVLHAAAQEDPRRAASIVRDLLPSNLTLTIAQRSDMSRALRIAVDRSARDNDGKVSAFAVLELMDRAERLGVRIPLELAARRVELLAVHAWEDAERIAAAIESAPVSSAMQRSSLRAAAVRALVRQDRADQALDLFGSLVERADGPREADVLGWMQLVGETGDASDARRLVEALDVPGEIVGVLREAFGDSIDPPEEAPALRAEMLYHLANLMDAQGRDEQSERTLREALRADPTHPWAANNLGYRLVVEGRDLREAERLIELAHAQLPDRASVVDSLGWVRYRLGKLEDTTGPDGEPVRGALSLLRRAVELDDRPSAELRDHLGDALWRTGERDEAIQMWSRAQKILEAQLEPEDGRAPEGPRTIELRAQLERVRAKLHAAERGAAPPVAAVLGDTREPAAR